MVSFCYRKSEVASSEACAEAQVKLNLPTLPKAKLTLAGSLFRRYVPYTHEVNFTIEDNFTCPQGQT